VKLQPMFKAVVIVAAILALVSCGGSLRYSKIEPEASGFSPRNIAVVSVDAGPHSDAAGKADEVIADVLVRTGRYAVVLTTERVREAATDEPLKSNLADYLEKLEVVNFSDPDLSTVIGEALGVEAFLVAAVSFWSHTLNPKGKEIARVGLEMKMIDVSTGRIVWTAHHFDEQRYRLFKPDLADVGRRVARKMIEGLPR